MAAWEFQQLQNIAEKYNWHKFISMQNYFNLTYREEEREMIPFCKDTGVGIIPWSPLARGLLARPFANLDTPRAQSDNILKTMSKSHQNEAEKSIVDRVEEIAKKREVPMATVATSWVLKKGAYPIVGLGSKERIDQAVDAIKFELTDEEAKYLEEPYVPKRVVGY
jgi:aryl-alcohol dehydrogenase-like predicted oxidoreductase